MSIVIFLPCISVPTQSKQKSPVNSTELRGFSWDTATT